MAKSRLFNVSILATQLVFISPAAAADSHSKVTASIEFLGYGDQTLFLPVTRPDEAGSTVIVNAGKTFTFGLGCDIVSRLARRFVMVASLHQTDPAAIRLSDVSVDVTRYFRAAVDEPDGGTCTPLQGKTTVEFFDEAGASIAHLHLTVRISVCGTTLVCDTSTGNKEERIVPRTDDGRRRRLPRVPEFRCPRKPMGANDGEWDTVCAELITGQKVSIKYRRNFYRFGPPAAKDQQPPDDLPLSTSERKLESYVLKLMGQMHKAVVTNREQVVSAGRTSAAQ